LFECHELFSSIKAAQALQFKIDKVLNCEGHNWYLCKMDPKEVAKRNAAAQAFKDRQMRK
jgi:hypothetical protein